MEIRQKTKTENLDPAKKKKKCFLSRFMRTRAGGLKIYLCTLSARLTRLFKSGKTLESEEDIV